MFKKTQSHHYFIKDAGHHLYFDKPNEFADKIIEDLKNISNLSNKE
jgi:pimeloyl-ACP methyl ester carboxylesterase